MPPDPPRRASLRQRGGGGFAPLLNNFSSKNPAYHFDMGNFTTPLVISLWCDNIGMALSLKMFTTIAIYVL